ncbi:hypothetical protein ACFWN2_03450 [Lentzea sp. NPDC058436]|uniref:hypothetical protein n=1 Tax=Lentzea sp. NPDC058436 TaxID=3346499 RepID=UPI00364B56FD
MSSSSRAVRRGLGLTGLAVALAFTAAATAQAAPATTTEAGTGVEAAAACTYVAIRDTVVRSGPGTQHPIVRTKKKGQQMTGPSLCLATNGWYTVYLSTGTLGYTPAADVRFVS